MHSYLNDHKLLSTKHKLSTWKQVHLHVVSYNDKYMYNNLFTLATAKHTLGLYL